MLCLALQDLWSFLRPEDGTGFLRIAITVPVVVGVLLVARRLIDRREERVSGQRFAGQTTMLALTFAGLVAVILALPVDAETKSMLLNVLALLTTAAIALASTTLLGNVLAGLMLRSMRNFRSGDFLRVEKHFGRVTERGLFHVEIQTEDRDLTTIPNVFLVTHPMTVVRASGTILSAKVTLGYDVPRERVRELLTRAAEKTELKDPFVRIVDLGDFAVEYRVGGLLSDVKKLLSRRTRLRAQMLDALHEGGVEIASPAIFSTRSFATSDRFVPLHRTTPSTPAGTGIESLAFDKADLAESLENLGDELEALKGEREELHKRRRESTDAAVTKALEDELERLTQREERLKKALASQEAEIGEEKTR